MIMEQMSGRKELIKILEALPEYQIPLVLTCIQALQKSLEEQEKRLREEAFVAYLDSLPEEDEELSEEGKRRIAEGEKAMREGRVYPFEVVAEELDL